MPKPKKSARGKHRWIGFTIENSYSRTEIERLLEIRLNGSGWRLFDVAGAKGKTHAILKTPLEEYPKTLSQINNFKDMETLTSSGKIRLVRERLNSFLGVDPTDSV
jgi:hypothetical protein